MTDHQQATELVALTDAPSEVAARSTRQAADEAFAWQCLKDALCELVDQARQAATASMEEAASEKQAVFNADGDRLGTVTYTPGVLQAEVLSAPKLLAWVKEHHPSEVVEQVNVAFIKVLMDRAIAQAEQDGVVSGEVLPGIHVGMGNPVMRIVKTKVGRETGRTILDNLIGHRRSLAG